MEYNYFIAPGVDAGLPIDTRNKKRDESAWESAKGNIDMQHVFYRLSFAPALLMAENVVPLRSKLNIINE